MSLFSACVGRVLDCGDPPGMPLEDVARRILPDGVRLDVEPPACFNVVGVWDVAEMTPMEALDALFGVVGYEVETVAGEGEVVIKARPYHPYDAPAYALS